MLNRLGKDTFSRGYYYRGDKSAKDMFSQMVKKSVMAENEDVGDFIREAKQSKITSKRWLELAMYCPQWAEPVGELLKIKSLEKAVWWFHAHASDYMNSEKETIVARYSQIESQDFENGALDINWFHEAYGAIGKKNWTVLHNAAKYISDGNAHRQVKLYSSVMLGEVKITETLKKVKEKRDKDYVKALGLISLSKSNPEKDVLKRYDLLQTFLVESKQFGAQRRESEAKAVEISLDNLARNAGYADRTRFSWAMETKAMEEIMAASVLKKDDVTFELRVDDLGKAEILVQKGDKKQKSIPAKYKKDKDLEKLKKNKTYLRKQYNRTRKSLENAMLNGDQFTVIEIAKLMTHPVVKAMLSKLVLFHPESGQAGYWVNQRVEDLENKPLSLTEVDKLIIAHPVHLYRSVSWDLYQRHAFEKRLVQPFKQIFRELYLITENEQESGNASNRYQGHQVQAKKTVALLRSRAWTVSYEEGLQKVYHNKKIMATVYSMADWFSPSEIESPTLETVEFYDQKLGKPLKLEDVDPLIFSEVMRDIDLVVSVAHVGAVDPEASHSSMEMRAVLAKESARLFKLNNVEFTDRHIKIDGKLGSYSIHLGSGLIQKQGLHLSIIPVHSQHRGRVFLPFVDDDPKSAEIISKMRMLSNDDKIKDPTILAQIHG